MEDEGRIPAGQRGFILYHLEGDSGTLVQKFQELDSSTKLAEAFEGKTVDSCAFLKASTWFQGVEKYRKHSHSYFAAVPNGNIVVLVKGTRVAQNFNVSEINLFSDAIDESLGLEAGTATLKNLVDEEDAYTLLAFKHNKK